MAKQQFPFLCHPTRALVDDLLTLWRRFSKVPPAAAYVRSEAIGEERLALLMKEGRLRFARGTFKNGKFDFCVSVRFIATETQLTAIKLKFERANQFFVESLFGMAA